MQGALEQIIAALAGDAGAGECGDASLGRVAAILATHTGGMAAVYVREPGGAVLVRRASVGAADGAQPAGAIDLDHHGDLRGRLTAGDVLGPDPAGAGARRPTGMGAGDARLHPVHAGAQLVGALLVAPGAGSAGADGLTGAAAGALGLALGGAQLAAGLRDRAVALDRRVRQLDALAEVARRVALSVDEDDVADVVAREARALLAADAAILFARDGVGRLRAVGSEGWTPAEPLPAVVGMAGADMSEPVWLGRELGVAVRGLDGGDGPAPGLLVVVRRGGAPFDDDEVARLTGLARQAGVALDNARLGGRLRRERTERHALAAALVDAQEEERRRVAEDIHDGPVQELVGVSLLLDALAADLRDTAPGHGAEAMRAASCARDALRALRRAIFDLHPMVLDELGFAAAVRTLVQRLEWQGVEVTVDADAAESLSAPLRTVAFRTCQEAIANVLRHAEPQAVWITARGEGPVVVVEVRDDGRGFDTVRGGTAIERGHIGLRALRERAVLVGGDLQVISAEGQGTRVRLTLPASGETST